MMEQMIYDNKPVLLAAAGVFSFTVVSGPIAFVSGALFFGAGSYIYHLRKQNSKKITRRRSKNFIA